MEKTIEERAKEAGIIYAGWNDTLRTGLQEGYKLGATEQKEIDIDKACGAYCAICYNRQTGCEKLCNDWKEFRKAMEE